jgi:hypothetical protein
MKRIQRKRTKGYRLPENAVYVGRPTKYGNPFKDDGYHTRDYLLRKYRYWLICRLHENPYFLDELKGKDLACWCPLDKSCHADVILKFLEAEL